MGACARHGLVRRWWSGSPRATVLCAGSPPPPSSTGAVWPPTGPLGQPHGSPVRRGPVSSPVLRRRRPVRPPWRRRPPRCRRGRCPGRRRNPPGTDARITPERIIVSKGLMAAARTSTTTSPGPGSGIGTSVTARHDRRTGRNARPVPFGSCLLRRVPARASRLWLVSPCTVVRRSAESRGWCAGRSGYAVGAARQTVRCAPSPEISQSITSPGRRKRP